MGWLSKFFGGNEEERVVCVESETQEESLELGLKLLSTMYPDDQYETTREDEFYCGICRGWVPISQFGTHGH